MRIKNLFTIPTGEKVTEKALRRVLISSICSILLCMTCLVGTTWAWFAVSIENKGNVIQIAEARETVTVTDINLDKTVDPVDGVYNLGKGEFKIHVQVSSDAAEKDELNKSRTPVYVLMSVKPAGASDPLYYYFAFAGGVGEAEQTVELYYTSAELRFSVSWMEPNANKTDNPIVIGEKPTEPPTTEPTTPESTTPPTTEPTTTEGTTEPTTEPTVPEGTTEPSVSNSPTNPSDPTTTVTEETTVPNTTESTEPAAGTDETTLPAEMG